MEQEMSLLDFLQKLAVFFPGGMTKEKSMVVINTYQDMLLKEIHKTQKKYNFKRLLEHILKEYQYKNYPSIADLIGWLPRGEIRTYEDFALNGGNIRVRFKSGLFYDFEPYYCKMTLKEIKAKFIKKYTMEDSEGKPYCTIESIKYLPPQYTVIGNKALDEETGEWLNEENWKAV